MGSVWEVEVELANGEEDTARRAERLMGFLGEKFQVVGSGPTWRVTMVDFEDEPAARHALRKALEQIDVGWPAVLVV